MSAAILDDTRRFQTPDDPLALWSLLSGLTLYASLWGGCFVALRSAPLVCLLVAPLAGLVLVRLFILQHDCGHGSLFSSQAVNNLVGGALGVLTLAPYAWWRRTHAHHHSIWGRLEHRLDPGYIDLLTVGEYRALGALGRAGYRAVRAPAVLIGVAGPLQFMLMHRLPVNTPFGWRREWVSVLLTDAGLLGLGALALQAGVLGPALLTQLMISWVAAAVGTGLFLLQHTFEGSYFRSGEDWDWQDAALHGCSRLDLPFPLDWLTGNIGLHHAHHLNPRLPFHRLPQVVAQVPALAARPALGLRQALRSLRLGLWCEQRGRLVRFSELEP